jgi:hypothetical protein
MVLRERRDLPDGLICRTHFTASSLRANGSGERPPDVGWLTRAWLAHLFRFRIVRNPATPPMAPVHVTMRVERAVDMGPGDIPANRSGNQCNGEFVKPAHGELVAGM